MRAEPRDFVFVVPTYRLRDVGETVEQYDEHFWRNGHALPIIVFDDSSPANQDKYFPLLEQTRTHNRVELERDAWQRPTDVLQQLNLTPGSVVVDLGCGAGYFGLKLSPLVGTHGQVLAEDIRRESLAFLWIRRFLRNARNVRVIRGDPDDPHLPPVPIDAVLIANTYHELDRRSALLGLLLHAMKSGGRLVIVDRGPRMGVDGHPGAAASRHDLRPGAAADEVQQAGFELVRRDDRFIDRPGEEDIWWLIAAKKR